MFATHLLRAQVTDGRGWTLRSRVPEHEMPVRRADVIGRPTNDHAASVVEGKISRLYQDDALSRRGKAGPVVVTGSCMHRMSIRSTLTVRP